MSSEKPCRVQGCVGFSLNLRTCKLRCFGFFTREETLKPYTALHPTRTGRRKPARSTSGGRPTQRNWRAGSLAEAALVIE